jgi:hypothetical protein
MDRLGGAAKTRDGKTIFFFFEEKQCQHIHKKKLMLERSPVLVDLQYFVRLQNLANAVSSKRMVVQR